MSKHQFLSSLLQVFGEIGNRDPVGRALAYCYGHALQHDPALRIDFLGYEINELVGSNIDLAQWEVKGGRIPVQRRQ
jgi:hypothetical protein